ncbi:MAG: hypothetical protein H0S77_10535, partial [Spirochaetaceae bacterium]|nr:hypothetical protein [Spirochaetaceae bacterium]
MKKRNLFLVCAVALLVFAMSSAFAAGVKEEAPAAQKSSTLTIGVSQEAVGLDPHIVTAFSSMR